MPGPSWQRLAWFRHGLSGSDLVVFAIPEGRSAPWASRQSSCAWWCPLLWLGLAWPGWRESVPLGNHQPHTDLAFQLCAQHHLQEAFPEPQNPPSQYPPLVHSCFLPVSCAPSYKYIIPSASPADSPGLWNRGGQATCSDSGSHRIPDQSTRGHRTSPGRPSLQGGSSARESELTLLPDCQPQALPGR